MTTSYPLPTLAPTIDITGISSPSYNDILQSLITSFKGIYGNDIYVEPDSQDGQWLAVLAQVIYQSNQAAVSCFLAFSPTYSQGTALSSLVKLNGIARKTATNSTAQGHVIGQAGTIISNGVVKDANGNLWSLPSPVTIPIGGSISVTVTAQQVGAFSAPIGTINQIYNPQFGWQSFSNTSAATIGEAVETDAELRLRQTISTATPALSIVEAIAGAVANVNGVQRSIVYENDTGSTDANGIPAHSISVVVLGGTSTDIATAIARRKTPGAQTYGSTTVTVYDSRGLGTAINFYFLTSTPIYFAVTIKALAGYVSTTGDAIKQAIADFVNGLEIGGDVYIAQAQAISALQNSPLGKTFYLTDFRQGLAATPTGTTNLAIAFNVAASCVAANVGLTVT